MTSPSEQRPGLVRGLGAWDTALLTSGIVAGVLVIMVLYTIINLAYLRALPLADLAASPRIGESAAVALLGPRGGQLMALAVLLALIGGLSAGILSAAWIDLPMAEDGVFFRSVARIHPTRRTPTVGLLAQGVWAVALSLIGTYGQMLGYVVLVVFLFHTATGVALFRLRRDRPDAARPYRVWGYPWVPGVFVLTSLLFVANTLVTSRSTP